MGLVQTSRPSGSGGGGSGITINGWQNQVFTQATNFISGGVTLALAQTPVLTSAVVIDYNGQVLLSNAWSLSGSTITILFADPDVTTYDQPPTFQVNYPY